MPWPHRRTPGYARPGALFGTSIAAILLVLRAGAALADDFAITSVAFTPTGAQIEGDASLAPVRAAIQQQLPGVLRTQFPDLFVERTVGYLKYRNFHADVDAVTFSGSGSDQEIGVHLRVMLRAERARCVVQWRGLNTSCDWRTEGSADAVQFDAAGRVAFSVTPPRTVLARALLDSVTGTVQLQMLQGLSAGASFNGRELQSRSIDVPVPNGVPASIQIDDARLAAVSGDVAHVRIRVSVPQSPASASPTSSGSP